MANLQQLLFVIVTTTASMVLAVHSLPILNAPVNQQHINNGEACGLDIEQQQYTCQLDKNETLKREFEQSIRVKHGITDPNYGEVFIALTATSLDQNIRCRSALSTCPNGNVTWCINVYHPTENIEACVDKAGLINATNLAQNLDLPSYYEVVSKGRLQAKKLPLYFSLSYLTCTVHDENLDCTGKTFTSLIVSFQDVNEVPPTISISPTSESNTTKLIIGKTNIFYCAGLYNRSTTLPFRYQGSWQINEVDQTNVIHEDPYCDPANNSDCARDLQNTHLKENRVRFYQLLQVISNCPIPTYVVSNWMVFDEATVEDAQLNYTCSASYVSFPSRQNIRGSDDLHLEAVYPEEPEACPPE